MTVFAMCGSFCTLSDAFVELEKMKSAQEDILPVMSEKTYSTDTRFGLAKDHVKRLEEICGKTVIHTVAAAEPIGPKLKPDIMVICPCTGNTLAKLANGITDSSVTMAAKAHLRNGKPLVICLATNDALSANLVNIGKLIARKNIYFVPMMQDDPIKKPTSLVADFTRLTETVEEARKSRQIMPVFLEK